MKLLGKSRIINQKLWQRKNRRTKLKDFFEKKEDTIMEAKEQDNRATTMDCFYERCGFGNELVIRKDAASYNYECKMLERNTIDGILPLEIHHVDGKVELRYKLMGVQPLFSLYEKRGMKEEELRIFLMQLLDGIENGKEYLLQEDGFLLEEEYIFVNPTNRKLWLCYVPDEQYNLSKQLLAFSEELLNKIDYHDKKAVALAYCFYKECKEGNSRLNELKAFLLEEKTDGKMVLEENTVQEENVRFEMENAQKKVVFRDEKKEITKKAAEETVKGDVSVKRNYVTLLAVLAFFIINIVLIRIGFYTNPVSKRMEYQKVIFVFGVMGLVLFSIARSNGHERKKRERLYKNHFFKVRSQCLEEQPVKRKQTNNCPEDIYQDGICPEDERTVFLCENTQEEQKTEKVLYLKSEEPMRYGDIELTEYPFFIGKQPKEMDFVLNQTGISRFHAKLVKEENHISIMDLNSTNGTFLNSDVLAANEKKELHEGDRIQFADCRYCVALRG